MNNNSTTLANITSGVNVNDLSTTSSVYDPKYSPIGTGTNPYYIGYPTTIHPFTNVDHTWTTKEWYTEPDHTSILDKNTLEDLQKWYELKKSSRSPAPTVVTITSPEIRRKMEISDDVGIGLMEMIDEI